MEETSQGFATFKRMMPNDHRMDIFLEEYRTGCMTATCTFCKRSVPIRGHHTWSLDASAEEIRHQPATLARISSTKRGPTTSSATHSTRSRESKPIRDFRNSSAGFTSSRTPPSSGPGEIAPEPVSPIADNRAVRCRGFFVPIAQSTERECPKLQVAGESPAGDTISRGCGSTAECGRAKAETTVRLRSPAPFSGT